MRKKSVLRNLLIDIVCAGLALVIFALFHHVLPRQSQGLGIVISNPYQTEAADPDRTRWLVPLWTRPWPSWQMMPQQTFPV